MSSQPAMLDRREAYVPHAFDPGFADAFAGCLLELGLIEGGALARAKRAAAAAGERIDHVLVKLGLIAESDLAAAYANFCSLPLLTNRDLPDRAVLPGRLKLAFLKANRLLPIACDDHRLILGTIDPFVEELANAASYMLDIRVERAIFAPAVFEEGMQRLYGESNLDVQADVERAALAVEDVGDFDVDRLRDIANEAPVIRLVNQIISRAVERRASDIHIEPGRDEVAIRYRVDGFLQFEQAAPAQLRAALTTRIKIMAKLDIAERRLPQDGRIKTAVRGVEIDMRVATVPTSFGESIVMRILDRSRVELDFAKLGLDAKIKDDLLDLTALPNGIILVTGPTGSGKTTTLYTALKHLNRPALKLFTVEDPVEYQLPGINQIQIQPTIGLDFPAALRSILRQDPDVIMIGEIRDLDTARIAIQASLTGHLVFSTLHTNSAVAAITRLVDLGLERFLLASTISAVMAQRLVRKLCPSCSQPHRNKVQLFERLSATLPNNSFDLTRVREIAGCEMCSQSGYFGRTMICELLVVTDPIREALGRRNQDQRNMEAIARKSGFRSLLEDGVAKVLAGETTIDEVLRVTKVT